MRETRGDGGRRPVGRLTCWRRQRTSSRSLCPCSWRAHPVSRRSHLRVVPAPGPEHDVALCRPAHRLHGQGSTSHNRACNAKSWLVCVYSSLCKDVSEIVSPVEKVEVRPASTSRSVGWPSALIALTSSWESLLQTCALFPLAPKALHFGPLIVAMVPSQSMCSVSRSMEIVPAVAAAWSSPPREVCAGSTSIGTAPWAAASRFPKSSTATTAQPNRRRAPLPEEEPSVNKCPSRSPCG